MRNEKGTVIFLAMVFSTLLVIAAAAVFSLVTGRFTITRHMNRRMQAIRDAESASYVVHQMIREGNWNIGDADGTRTVTLTLPGGGTRDVDIDLNEAPVSGHQPVSTDVEY